MNTTENQYAMLSNGMKIPMIGLGTWRIGDDEALGAIKTALEIGYRHIDTASIYGNEQGVGAGIRGSGVSRKDIFLTSKVWNDDQGYDSTLKAFNASLERLGTDYLDLYLIHWPTRRNKDTWRAMETLYREGKVKAIGVSNFQTHHLEDLLAACEIKPMVNQVEFHPYLVQSTLFEFCRRNHIQIEAWSPLMQGKMVDVSELKDLGEKYNCSVAQIILRWDIQMGVVTIPKSIRRDRMKENVDIFDFTISEEDMALITALDRGKRFGPNPDNFGF